MLMSRCPLALGFPLDSLPPLGCASLRPARVQAMPADPATTEQVASENPAQQQYSLVSSGIDLANITTPTLVIAGQQDQVLPFGGDLDILNGLQHASLISFPDSGHATILQHALTCGAIISAWLDQDAVQSSGVLTPE